MADKIDLVIQRIDDLKDNTADRLDSIDSNLAEHMRRTDVLEQLHMDNQDRINMLEEPRKALLLLKTVVLYISAVSGAAVAILKIFGGI